MSLYLPSYTPSYKRGYARSAAESANPGLWKGLVGCWMPSLGPTGSTLRDVSGWGNHGTLTNMDASTDWVVGEKGGALDYDGSDHVAVPYHTLLDGDEITISVWVKFNTLAPSVQYAGIVSRDDTNDAYNIVFTDSTNTLAFAIRKSAWSEIYTSAVITRKWYHLVLTHTGDTMSGYVDGQFFDSDTNATAILRKSSIIKFGQYGSDGMDCSIATISTHSRALTPNEIQQLYVDPYAIVRQRARSFVSIAAGTPLGIFRSISTSWLQSRRDPRGLPMQWLKEQSKHEPLPLDWVFSQDFNKQSPISWLSKPQSNSSLNISYLDGLSDDFQHVVGWIQDIDFSNTISTAWLNGLPINDSANIEWKSDAGLTASEIFQNINVEWTNLLASQKQVNTNWLADFTRDSQIQVGWRAAVSDMFELLPAEYLGGIKLLQSSPMSFNKQLEIGQSLPIDWFSITFNIEAFKSLPLDWLTEKTFKDKLPIDWSSPTTDIEIFKSLPIDWATDKQIHAGLPINWGFTSSPLLGGIWILDTRGTVWILGVR